MRLRILGTAVVILGFAFSLCLGQPGRAETEAGQAIIQEEGAAVADVASGGVLAEDVAAEEAAAKELFDYAAVGVNAPVAAESGEQYTVSLERAIQIARGAVAVPQEMDQFSSSFSQSPEGAFWDLNWQSSNDVKGGSISVRVNAVSGDIWSMYKWLSEESGARYRGLPTYTRERAAAVAVAYAKRLQPDYFSETVLQPGRYYMQPLSVRERSSVTYDFYYVRYIGDVIYQDNGINVTVNGDTGEVTWFSLNWSDSTDFPPPAGRISREQAEEIFHAEAAPELCYFYSVLPYGGEGEVQLVYKLPEHLDRFVVDALSGELLSNEIFYAGSAGSFANSMETAAREDSDAFKLRPAEEKQVVKLENLISQEKAQELAQVAVTIPEDYVLTNSSLGEDYRFKENVAWSFGWWPTDRYSSRGGGVNVSVDAVSGEIVSFYYYYDNYETPAVNFSEAEARRIAEDYLKENQPDRWAQVVFSSLQPQMVVTPDKETGPQPRAYTINYTRLANEVKFPQNGFYLEVNSSTGEITSYQMNWYDLTFPAPEGLISREAAADKYLQNAPLTIGYLPWWTSEKSEIHLVYYMPNRYFEMLDAATGENLDYQGKVVSAPRWEKESFSDLAEHPARVAVELLADAGIIAGGNGSFRPGEPITQAELLAMLVRIFDQSLGIDDDAQGALYESYCTLAALYGILPVGEKPEQDALVDRETLAAYAVRCMGLKNVAELSDIYLLDFPDADDVSAQMRGYVAISAGLGLIQPLEGYFQPRAAVTRGEAAETLLRLLQSGK